MKILVTGSAGFVASTLIPVLRAAGHDVFGIDLNFENHSNAFFQHDLVNPVLVKLPMFDLCIHLASRVGGILHNHFSAELANYELQLLKTISTVCADQKCSRLIYMSSVSVFEQDGLYSNEVLSAFNQKTPYAKGKAVGESYVQKNFSEFVIIRPTNIFGKDQMCQSRHQIGYSHVIPELLKKIDENDVVEILGDGNQVRNFIHVSDVCRFILGILNLPGKNWFNLRSELELSIGNLVRQLLDYRGVRKTFSYQPEFLKFEPKPIKKFDLSPAYKTGWLPQVKSIADGLLF